jgi:hypothetical protein
MIWATFWAKKMIWATFWALFSQKFWSPWRHCCETFASERLAPRDRDTSDPFE